MQNDQNYFESFCGKGHSMVKYYGTVNSIVFVSKAKWWWEKQSE